MAKHELLSDAEREQLLGIPRERDQLARLYTLERSDFDIIQQLIAFIAEQLAIAPNALSDYASREQTMTDHARELATALGFRGPDRMFRS
jgi:hypothetical protein